MEDSAKTSSTKDLIINKTNFVSFKKGNITVEYDIKNVLGSGSFGTVRKAVHKLTGQVRAIKILKKSEQNQSQLFREVEILCKLSHPNIMQIFEFYDDSKNFYVVSEFCNGGELLEKISDSGAFSEDQAKLIMRQLLSVVAYSHANKIVHRDLKPENILLDNETGSVIKVIDWGEGNFIINIISEKLFEFKKDEHSCRNFILHCSGSFR
jgi:calcium-dependent protein kinase